MGSTGKAKYPRWDGSVIGDLSGKLAVVTGSSSGIGYETARILAEKHAHVIVAVRDLRKGTAAADRIRGERQSARVEVMEVDLANLASVDAFARAVREKTDRIDLLINNAGVMLPPFSRTADGFELQMGTNHLGHYALTGHLLPLLTASPGSRIVNVTSMAHRVGNLDFNDLDWERRSYKPVRAYGDSKIANLYFTFELARRLASAGADVTATAAHPGYTATELMRHSSLLRLLNRFFAQSAVVGALPTLRAALDPEATAGAFFGPSGFMQMRGRPVRVECSVRARDRNVAGQLWEFSRLMTGVDIDATLANVTRRSDIREYV
jgi:NAD(P)-dependent dehydrogenase (short-subunit alcohol dehydrogenase family)